MRTIFALAFLICAVVAEYCDRDSDCKLTTCGTNFRLDCYRDNVCTCIPTSSGSSNYACPNGDASVCQQNNGDCEHGDHRWHCIDMKCVCRWFG